MSDKPRLIWMSEWTDIDDPKSKHIATLTAQRDRLAGLLREADDELEIWDDGMTNCRNFDLHKRIINALAELPATAASAAADHAPAPSGEDPKGLPRGKCNAGGLSTMEELADMLHQAGRLEKHPERPVSAEGEEGMSLVLDTINAGGPCLRCTRCGHRAGVPLPIAVADLAAISLAMLENHRTCRPADAADCWGDYSPAKHMDRLCDLCTARPGCAAAARGL